MFDLIFWQTAWFFLIGAALFIFTWLDGFDLGIGMRLPFIKTPQQRMGALNILWPVWDGNELYGLIGGGAIFATFPVVFAGLLSGLYPWLVLLLLFIMLRPITFEAWLHEPKNKRIWEYTFMASSFVIPFVAGVAVGATMAGMPFDGTQAWAKGHGFWEVLSPFSVLMGGAFVAVSLLQGSTYLVKKASGDLAQEARKDIPLLVLINAGFLAALVILAFTGSLNLAGKPLLVPGLILAVLLIGGGLAASWFFSKKTGDQAPFWSSSALIAGVWVFIGCLQFPVMIHSSIAPAFDLSIYTPGVSNPLGSLQFIGIVAALGLAIVLVYSILVYRVFKGKVDHNSAAHY